MTPFTDPAYGEDGTTDSRLVALPPHIVKKFRIDSMGCWVWTGADNGTGYGKIWAEGRTQYATRVIYQLLVGPIPENHDMDHLCRVVACVNPDHLEPVSHRENCLRGESRNAINARKTHCKRGHEFTEANTIRRADTPNTRQCLECRRTWDLARSARRRLASA